jgi:hypothetical protein
MELKVASTTRKMRTIVERETSEETTVLIRCSIS